ncbi:MAG: hypothetical protein GF355_13105 [Candidatus Eisenbacteria bacterium]|nr:hypothetical protein [Candidatus Eisenbacteria bacterium]
MIRPESGRGAPAPDLETSDRPGRRAKVMKWFKRFGLAGFLFFLVKGLLWLAIPALIAMGIFE